MHSLMVDCSTLRDNRAFSIHNEPQSTCASKFKRLNYISAYDLLILACYHIR
jgi:hypothetical protein